MVLGFGKKGAAPGTEGDSPSPGAPGTEAVRAEIRKARNRGSRVAEEAAIAAQAAELDELYEGENWEEVANIYFDTRFALTGYEDFRLTQSEKARLGVSLAATMRLLIRLDPAYAALLVFTVNFGSIVARKEMAWHYHKRQEEARTGGDGHGA